MADERSVIQSMRKMSEHSASLLLLLLLSADLIFIVLHIANAIVGINASLYDIGGNGSYAETHQFVKLLWIMILFAYVLKSTKRVGYGAWILIFLCFLIVKSLNMHQIIGALVAGKFSPYLSQFISLQPRHFGELAVLAIAGAFLSVIMIWAYLRSSTSFREVSKDMLVLMTGFVFFGIFLDLFAAIRVGPLVKFGLRTLEDGGEMVMVSLMLWYVFLLALRKEKLDWFLHDILHESLLRRAT